MSDFNENNQQEIPVNSDTAEPQVQQDAFSSEAPSDLSFGPDVVSGAEKKKKKHVGIIAAVTAVVVLAGGSAAAYNLVPSVKNTVKMAVLDDDEYYQWVESENSGDLAECVSEFYDSLMDTSKTEAEVQLKAKLNSDAITPLLESYAGASLAESGFKLPENISLNSASRVADGQGTVRYSLNADDASLVTANGFIKDSAMYFQIPELSSDYIAIDFDTVSEVYDEALSETGADVNFDFSELMNSALSGENPYAEYLSSEDLETLITTYSDVLFSNIEDVDLEKKVEKEANGIEQKYTVITADIDEGTVYSIASDALKKAKNDKILTDLAEDLGLCTKDEYKEMISSLQSELGDYEIKGGETIVTMNVYVDSNGVICGRDFEIPGEDADLGYLCAKDGDELGIDASFTANGEGVKVTGSFEEKSGKVDGTLDISAASGGESQNIKLSFEDMEAAGKNDEYLNGTISADLSSLGAGVYSLVLESDGKSQTMSTDITIDGTTYAEVSLVMSEKVSSELPVFDDSAKVYSFTEDGAELEEYAANTDIEGMLNNIGNAFGISDLGTLATGGMNSYVDDDLVYEEQFDDESSLTDEYDPANYSSEVTYDMSKIKLQLNGTDITLPSKIDGILDYVTAEDEKIEAGGFRYYSSDDFCTSVSLDNTGTADAAPKDCQVSGISVYEGSKLNLTIDGFGIGSSISDVTAKYSASINDPDSGYVTVYDTGSSWNSISFSYMNGKVYAVSVNFYD
ncbi:MAG: hypothetical protein ACI4I9_04900 [Porcipelethomonas sp.]